MFNVTVLMQIHGCFATCSSRDVYVQRDVKLPFAPYNGLTIRDGEWWAEDIRSVRWECDKERFVCYLESDKEIYNAQLHKEPARTIEEIVKEYTDDGWKVRETL